MSRFYAIKGADGQFANFEDTPVSNQHPYWIALNKAALYLSASVAEADRKDYALEGWSGFASSRVVPVELHEVEE